MYIWEVVKQTPESFGGVPILYRGHRKGSGGPLGGASPPGGALGLRGELASPWWAGRTPSLGPLRLGLRGEP